ncbi:MAG TPA: nucleotidyl transferase AbiEii/AbiGii toxin family protein [Candidatus Angelobacter sp.]|nr:nucleotidyl transferase AbiEii/AbiGii toxin family protein [Candidatus Angelobacter sp.]
MDDLIRFKEHCQEFRADLVIIGAIAFLAHFPDELRYTADIDFAVALDLNEFAKLEKRLLASGWARAQNREHRWRSAGGTLLDLIPAGHELRKAKEVVWPKSKFAMSLFGFDHVFLRAEPVQFAEDLEFRVIPPIVLMLLKIVAFMDDQNERVKDLIDIRSLMRRYETDSDRLFSDVVLNAELKDFDMANALLLGFDLAALCSDEEVQIVWNFIAALGEDRSAWMSFVRSGSKIHTDETARLQLIAFTKGFATGR